MTPRALAIQVLSRVAATDAFLNVVLDSQLSEHPFPERRDAALATELCYGATRRQMTLDHLLRPLSERPLERLEDRVLAALRLGAYQMFYLRIPRRAVVAATVEALKEVGLSRAAGFVNAVLRKASAIEAIPLPPATEIAEHLAIRESHPAWLVRRWIRQFGQPRAEAMLIANNQPPPLTVRSNSTRVSREELLSRFLAAGLEARPGEYSSQGISLFAAGKPEDLPGFAEGLWQVQDEAAQCVVQFADFPAGHRILDACAAPGGKACHLAERGEVLACDKHRLKLAKLKAEAARLGLGDRIETLVHDATSALPETIGLFRAVLIDAPCSGLGTLRRHPEIRYRLEEAALGPLSALQLKILEGCQHSVQVGGLLVYSVCSVDPQESQDVIEMFLRSHPDFTSEPSARLPPHWNWQGFLRTLPGAEGLDGFFAARMRRLANAGS